MSSTRFDENLVRAIVGISAMQTFYRNICTGILSRRERICAVVNNR